MWQNSSILINKFISSNPCLQTISRVVSMANSPEQNSRSHNAKGHEKLFQKIMSELVCIFICGHLRLGRVWFWGENDRYLALRSIITNWMPRTKPTYTRCRRCQYFPLPVGAFELLLIPKSIC